MIDSQFYELLNVIAKGLLRSAGLGFLLILLWYALYRLVPGPIYAQGQPCGLTAHDVDVIH